MLILKKQVFGGGASDPWTSINWTPSKSGFRKSVILHGWPLCSNLQATFTTTNNGFDLHMKLMCTEGQESGSASGHGKLLWSGSHLLPTFFSLPLFGLLTESLLGLQERLHSVSYNVTYRIPQEWTPTTLSHLPVLPQMTLLLGEACSLG